MRPSRMPSHPAVFLAGETRQVWALRRDTSAPVFLDVGEAAAMREFTKQHLRCLYPRCEATLSTRGGSKRDHFFHVGTVPHETGRETENHLAAKAMLAEWLRRQVPDGATVHEEQTVKNPKTSVHRRPDVLATGQTGRRVAFEVEYKSWPIVEWERKQEDLDSEGIVCLWLIGHTRVRPGISEPVSSNLVRLPALAAEMARRGSPLLVVNPATREIGTLTDSRGDRLYDGRGEIAWLQVDALDDCRFSPTLGIRTPAMLVIEAADRRRTEIDAQRQEQREQWAAAWQTSSVRAAFARRWDLVPEDLAAGAEEIWREAVPAIAACPKHWASAIYEDLIRDRREPFRMDQVLATLAGHGLAYDRAQAGPALHGLFRHLRSVGLITIRDRKKRYAILPRFEFTPTGRTFEDIEDHRERVRQVQNATEASRAAREAELEARRRTKQINLPDGTVRWVRK